jgi:hypothetical protein
MTAYLEALRALLRRKAAPGPFKSGGREDGVWEMD